ncbi:MAG: thiol protease/hemagglutinin PrtT [Candidatus Cloacimonetes bacterium]|nr:thiol protease/hemagglutinin PrtT [Candidatus Cloacimonadota bacterium]
MKRLIPGLALILLCATIYADPVSLARAESAARAQLQRLDGSGTLLPPRPLGEETSPLAWVFGLEPQGYIVVSAADDLPPVLAYSFTANFDPATDPWLAELISADLTFRQSGAGPDERDKYRQMWQNPFADRDDFEQWPPPGYSPSGGWIKTEWHQSAPYNADCPIDPVTGQRSVAGCPAVAMAQIVNYHQSLNGTRFTDADDYHHNYAGRNFWIDDDHAAQDFPSWAELNTALDTLTQHYAMQQATTSADAAALIWACGAAAEQVYTSSGSGTFAVSQAFNAFQRFGFDYCELLTASAPDLNFRMAQNIKDAQPVHLAVVTPAWDAGHNVAVDGYNTDGFFHVNFGWGGSQSGWYLLPDQLPYNLTVVEGAIVDIEPRQYLMAIPDTLLFLDNASIYEAHELELVNISDASLTISDLSWTPYNVVDAFLVCELYPGLPRVLEPGQSMIIYVHFVVVEGGPREIITGSISIAHSCGCYEVPILIDSSLPALPAEDQVAPVVKLSAWPNPFGDQLELASATRGPLRVSVYNLKGQKLATLEGEGKLSWSPGAGTPAGIYLIKDDNAKNSRPLRVVKIR